jgi:hypothetical protein
MQVSIPHELAQGARWYLVHTRPNSERKAEFNLQAQGFATFLPQIEKTIRHARRLKTVRRPLFSRGLRPPIVLLSRHTPSSTESAKTDPGLQQPSSQAQTTLQRAGPPAAPSSRELTQWLQTITRGLANLEQGIGTHNWLVTMPNSLRRSDQEIAQRI